MFRYNRIRQEIYFDSFLFHFVNIAILLLELLKVSI